MKGRDCSEDLLVDEKLILEWMLQKLGRMMWRGCIWLRIKEIS
jgi:hypothetical protein